MNRWRESRWVASPRSVAAVLCLFVVGAAALVMADSSVLLYQKDGAASGDVFGHSVAGAGDVNGDGYDDFIIGAYGANPGGRSNAGSAYVYSGLDGILLYQKDGAAADDYLGSSVAGAGDVNLDGHADFIIGAFKADPGGRIDAGSVYVYSGLDGTLLHKKDGASGYNPVTLYGDHFGSSVAGAGDVNGDGYADFIAGAPYANPGQEAWAGSAYVYSGLDGSLLYQKDGGGDDRLGNAVAGAGDVNGDNKDDFIIGAFLASPGGQASGSAYVYSGLDGGLLHQKDGTEDLQLVGNSVAGAGDVNADGKDDFIIGANQARYGGDFSGSAFVYSGLDGALLYRKDGVAYDQLGWSVSGAGDVNLDGHADFLIGAHYADPGGNALAGSAYLYSGLDGTLLHQHDGVAASDLVGNSVAGAGDVNGDGRADIILGAHQADPGGQSGAGIAYVIVSGVPCTCPCAYEPVCDGNISDVLDVVQTISTAFRGQAPTVDEGCPRERTDVDCSGVTDILDVVKVVYVGFRAGNAAVDYCDPCL